MLNKSDLKYILKRVITFVLIALIICLLGSCKAEALVIPKPGTTQLYIWNNPSDHSQGSSVLSAYADSYTTKIIGMYEYWNTIQYNNNTRLNGMYEYFNMNSFSGQHILNMRFAMTQTFANGDVADTEVREITAHQTNGQYITCGVTSTEAQDITISGDPKVVFVYNIKCILTAKIDNIFIGFEPNFSAVSTNKWFYIEKDFQVRPPATTEELLLVQEEILRGIDRQNAIIENAFGSDEYDNLAFPDMYDDILANLPVNNVVTQLVGLPVTLLQKYYTAWNSGCTTYDLGSLYGTHLRLPCVIPENYLGQNLWFTIDMMMSGFLILTITKKFVKIFDDFTNLRTNQINELYGGGV